MFQDVIDGIVILAMFFLRIGVPIIVTLGVGIWLEKKLRPQETQAQPRDATTRRGTIIPFPRVSPGTNASALPLAHCWDVKQCDSITREKCAAYKRPDLPCWLALQAAGGKVRAECADCELYTKPRRVVA